MSKQLSLAIALTVGVVTAVSCKAAKDDTFTVNRQLINPLCLDLSSRDFTPYLAQPEDQDLNDILNLNACQASLTKGRFTPYPKENDICGLSPVKESKQCARYDYPWGMNDDFDMTLRRGFTEYAYIGKSKSGIDAVYIMRNTGGNGIFESIGLFKRIPMKSYRFGDSRKNKWSKEPFIGLLNVGEIDARDCNSENFVEINLNGNTLTGVKCKWVSNSRENTKEEFTIQLP